MTMSQVPVDSEECIFDLFMRRQFRFGNFKLALDAVGVGYQPRALLHLSETGLTLTRLNFRGQPMKGSSTIPASWTWRFSQVVEAQRIVVNSSGWGLGHPPAGLRLDIHGESFYPLLASYAIDELVDALQNHRVAVDLNPRKLSLFLTGWK
jgi:hypothetical protein